MHGWKKIVFMKPYLYFLSLKHFRLFVFVKNYYDRFFTNIFIKPENINEKSQSCMTGVCPPGKFLFKTMKNIKIADPVVIMNSFYD